MARLGLPQLGWSALKISRMGRAYGSARAVWLGTRNPTVDDTTVTFVTGCVSAAGVDLSPTERPVRLSMAMTAKNIGDG